MKKLIDADALIAKLEIMPIDIGYEDINRVLQIIEDQPETIVRCKYCKHRPKGEAYNHKFEFPDQDYKCPCRCEDYWYSWMPKDDWYCANGERKIDE